MAGTFEGFKLFFQFHALYENLRRDMRLNAQSYIDLLATKTVAEIVAIADQNTNAYHVVLQWSKDAWDNTTMKTKIQNALAGMDIPDTEITSAYQLLKTTADDERLAMNLGITTSAGVQSMAGATLGNLPAHDTMWPNG